MQTRRFCRVLGSLALLSVVGCGTQEEAELVSVTSGLASPESVLFAPQQESWFVSNVAGTAEQDGYISRLHADGSVAELVFAGGLNDPKGQGIDGQWLYVTDRTRVVAIDLEQPERRTVIEVPGSQFLNDVAIDPVSHAVYVSDTFADSIYRIADGEATLLLRDAALEAPNGLYFVPGALFIASVGPNLDPTNFSTSEPGRISKLDLETLTLSPVSERLGGLDGLELDRSGWIVSATFKGVYHLDFEGQTDLLVDNAAQGLASSADVGFDPVKRRLAVPELRGTRVAFFDIDTARSR